MNDLNRRLQGLGLSPRERETTVFVSKGLTNKETARFMYLTEKGVKFHLTNIFKKLNVKSRAELIVFCSNQEEVQDGKCHRCGL